MAIKLLLPANDVELPGSNKNYPGTPITEIITNGFFTVDPNWTVKYWNKSAEKILGVQAQDIVGRNLWEKFSDAIPVEFYSVYHKKFLEDIPPHFEEYWREMGAWFDVITYHSDNTLSVSFKSSSMPVQPEQAEKQLKILTELYRFVTEITNDCLWEWNLQTGEIFWIDGGHKRVFGYQVVNALISRSFWESLLHPDDKVRVLKKLNKAISNGSGGVWEDEYRFRKSDGGYAYVQDRGHIIYDDGKIASRMIGATQDITARVLLENKLAEERTARQREITNAVLTALENEREDIGKELHDNLGQILAVAKLYIQMAKTYKDKRELYLDKSCDFIENVIVEIRKISKTLVIPGPHIISMTDNIKNLVHDLVATHPMKIEFNTENIDENELDEKIQLTIFRIVQEQVNNILKHAKATRAAIHLSRQEDQIILDISDNGEGVDMLKEKNGVGIINIKSRVELYHGRVTIGSKPGDGFELKVELPFIAAPENHIEKAMKE
jgi:PAS domain S-box-containing protein